MVAGLIVAHFQPSDLMLVKPWKAAMLGESLPSAHDHWVSPKKWQNGQELRTGAAEEERDEQPADNPLKVWKAEYLWDLNRGDIMTYCG